MYKLIAPALLALSAFTTPVAAAGIHDFTPERARPTSTTTSGVRGSCFQTKDNSRACYIASGNGTYAVSILDNDDRRWPAQLLINCRTGQWRAWSKLTSYQVKVWANTFCQNVNN